MAGKIRKLTSLAMTFMLVCLAAEAFLQFCVFTPTVYAQESLTLVPDGDGDYTNIGVVTGATTHWEAVDDPVGSPDDVLTYVTTTEVQEKDAYTLANTTQTGTITSVKVYFRFRSTAPKAHYAQPFLRLSGTESAGTDQAHSTNIWTTYSEIIPRPGGGSWTWADINNLQVAVGLTDSGLAGTPQLTQVYVEVTYETVAEESVSQGITIDTKTMQKAFGRSESDCWWKWRMGIRAYEKPIHEDFFYALVDLKGDPTETPDVFIVPSKELNRFLEPYPIGVSPASGKLTDVWCVI